MTRHFLRGEAHARYTEARLDAIRMIATVADDVGCAFVVVAGDVFESNYLDRRTVVRALDAMGSFVIPLFLLPGNHDPVDASSIYQSPTFVANCPPHVVVLKTFDPIEVPGTDIAIIGAPWDSKRPLEDLVAKATAAAPGDRRSVLVGHGIVDAVPVGDEYPSTLIPWRDDVVFYQGNSLKVFDRAGRNVWAIEFPKGLASVAVNDRFLICGAGALDVFERN